MATKTLETRRSSASLWGERTGIRHLPVVAKYIDTSTCIGCKACEVACQEWNDLGPVHTVQRGSYQTLPNLHPEFWNLIRFDERETDNGFAWLMRKDQCMHCEDPGCLKACPAPGAIVQYENGIVDVNPEQCIGCGYCAAGCPFDVPKFHPTTGKMAKCTLCVDRVGVGMEPACVKACPTGCLQFGTKEDMVRLGHSRVQALQSNGFAEAALYDPPGVGGTSVVTVLAHGNHPEWYHLARDPQVPLGVRFWKSWLRPLGGLGIVAAILAAIGHYLFEGPKKPQGEPDPTPAGGAGTPGGPA